jgi:hypothetical protein
LQNTPAEEPLRRLWAFLTSPPFAGILLALAASLLTLSALFPQFSPALSGPAAQERWIAETAARWGTLGPTLRSLGVFQIQDSLLWKMCLGLGVLVLLLRLEASAGRAWGFMRVDVSELTVRFREEATVAQPRAQVLAGLRRGLEERGFRVRITQANDLEHLHAVARPWASSLRAVLCLGILLMLASLLLSGAAAQWEQIAVGPGESEPLSLRAGWSALLRDFAAEAGSERFRGQLAVFGPEADLLAEGTVAMERPLWVKGLTLHMSGTGPGLRAEATDASGRPLMLQPASGAAQTQSLFLRFDEDQPEQYFAVPDTEDTVRVVLHPGGRNGGQEFLVQVYRGAEVQPRVERLLSVESSLEVDGATYHFAATRYPMLMAASNPAKWLLWAGAALSLLAVVLMRLFGSRVVLARVAGGDGETHMQFLTEDADTMETARRALSGQDSTEGAS